MACEACMGHVAPGKFCHACGRSSIEGIRFVRRTDEQRHTDETRDDFITTLDALYSATGRIVPHRLYNDREAIERFVAEVRNRLQVLACRAEELGE